MVKAKFNGDGSNPTYQCAEFHAVKNNTVNMPNARWSAIGAEGKQGLFTLISSDETPYPTPTTVGPK